MDFRRLSPDLAVSPQIAVSDVAELAAAGFKSVVCNRPDGEDPGQPPFAEIEAAAKAAGMETRWQPVASGGVTEADGIEFARLYAELPKPVFAYCRSGTRCSILWSYVESQGLA